MASTVGNQPAHYRARAQKAREEAKSAPNEAIRKQLLHDADTWERMADYEAKNPTHDLSEEAEKPLAGAGSGSPFVSRKAACGGAGGPPPGRT